MNSISNKLQLKSPYLRARPHQRFNKAEENLIRTSYMLPVYLEAKMQRCWKEKMSSASFRVFYDLRIKDGAFTTADGGSFIVEWANHPVHCFKHCEEVELCWREAPEGSNLFNYVVIFAKR